MDERLERGSICLVAHDLAYVARNVGTGTYFWSLAFALAEAGWSVHVLYCGPAADPTALITARARMDAAGIALVTLDDMPLAAYAHVPQMGGGAWGISVGLQVMHALKRLHGEHHFDLIEFGDWQGVGFRTVQAKRRGLGFADVDLLVRLHAPSRWERQENGSLINTLDDHTVDFCERYAFENCDTQFSTTRDLARWVADQHWDVREDLIVSCRLPTVDDDRSPVVPIEELGLLGHLVEHYAEALQRSRGRARRHLGPPAPKRPLVTVAVTHFNLGTELAELLPTLAAQTYANAEVLVIDDGSTEEESRDRFNDLRQQYTEFKFLEQANEGPGPARNRLLYSCAGELFIPVDSDNLAMPHMVERFVDSMGAPDQPDVLACFFLAFTDRSQLVSERFDYQYTPTGGPLLLACVENVFGDANAAFRTEVFRASGGFECDAQSPCEDWETFVRFISNGARFDVIPEPLFHYRLRPTSRSRTLGKAKPLDLQRRMLAQFADLKIDDELRRRLWETAISFRALEHRHHEVHEQLSAMTQHAQQLQVHADQLTAQLANPRLRNRVTDGVDRVSRRFPLLRSAFRRTLAWTGAVARWRARRQASREDLSE